MLRLRIGIGDRENGDLSSFVLGKFTEEERKELPQIVDKSAKCAEFFYSKDVTEAMSMANINERKSKNKEIKNDNG